MLPNSWCLLDSVCKKKRKGVGASLPHISGKSCIFPFESIFKNSLITYYCFAWVSYFCSSPTCPISSLPQFSLTIDKMLATQYKLNASLLNNKLAFSYLTLRRSQWNIKLKYLCDSFYASLERHQTSVFQWLPVTLDVCIS